MMGYYTYIIHIVTSHCAHCMYILIYSCENEELSVCVVANQSPMYMDYAYNIYGI